MSTPVQLLIDQALNARARGDFLSAADLLVSAHRSEPNDPTIPLILAAVHRDAGSDEGEVESLAIALAIDPYCWPALLARGQRLERIGKPKSAALVYKNVLRIAPPRAHWPDSYREAMLYAERMARFHTEAIELKLLEALGPAAAGTNRWAEAASIMAGRTRAYHADCNQLTVPRLPAIPFFDRADFPWVPALEAQTDTIRAELIDLLNARRDDFTPYIAYRPGDPVNQWAELNQSTRWSTYKLWAGGERVEENLLACPKTAAALEAVDMASIGGLCPNAMFSALAPHTEIPPHHGETNARLVVHLPLIVPENCSYRVGFEQRSWREGEVLIFDDTIEHTARNDSDHLRVVLIFDVWNPLLSTEERAIVQTMTRTMREFSAE